MSRMFSPMKRPSARLTEVIVSAAILMGITSSIAEGQSLQGVWGVVTQERNCATNAAMGTPTRALVTFHSDGTLTESRTIPVFAIGQLSEGHGTWSSSGGATYTGRVVTMVQFETAPGTPPGSPGFQAGWQIATQTITLTGPDAFTMTGSSQFFNLNREVWRTGCASRVGERFK